MVDTTPFVLTSFFVDILPVFISLVDNNSRDCYDK